MTLSSFLRGLEVAWLTIEPFVLGILAIIAFCLAVEWVTGKYDE